MPSAVGRRKVAVKNVDQVALEVGNSPDMSFEHYRELVRPKGAKEWFAIIPKPGRHAQGQSRERTQGAADPNSPGSLSKRQL